MLKTAHWKMKLCEKRGKKRSLSIDLCPSGRSNRQRWDVQDVGRIEKCPFSWLSKLSFTKKDHQLKNVTVGLSFSVTSSVNSLGKSPGLWLAAPGKICELGTQMYELGRKRHADGRDSTRSHSPREGWKNRRSSRRIGSTAPAKKIIWMRGGTKTLHQGRPNMITNFN